MNILKQNMENIYGERGKLWVSSLPHILAELAIHWKLSNILPVDNMTFNYVAKATTNTNVPVVLKISYDEKSISDEILALKYFDGSGSIQLIAHNERYHALLLQQAVPGITLKSLYPSQIEYVMDCYIDTMRLLHSKPLPKKNNYRHISDWLMAIDNLKSQECPLYLIQKAIALKNTLLTSMTAEIFLHGDLHHDNLLKDGEHWLAIDPKGIVGESEFEMAAFDFMNINELANMSNVKNILEARIDLLAAKAQLNPKRINDWIFIRLILMAAWHVEDNGDPSGAMKLAEALM
jgi:streptomycin 6-kinase